MLHAADVCLFSKEVYHVDFRSLTTHRTWEDWCGCSLLLDRAVAVVSHPAGHEVVDAERSFVI
jgi:hypothetical protein